MKGFLLDAKIEIFENIPLEVVLKHYYPWLVLSLLSIENDPLDHLYPLSPEKAALLDNIAANTFEKYKNEEPPFFYNDDSEKKLYKTLDRGFHKLFDEEEAELEFQTVQQDLIRKYEDFMEALVILYRMVDEHGVIEEAEDEDVIDEEERDDFLTADDWTMVRLLTARKKIEITEKRNGGR